MHESVEIFTNVDIINVNMYYRPAFELEFYDILAEFYNVRFENLSSFVFTSQFKGVLMEDCIVKDVIPYSEDTETHGL